MPSHNSSTIPQPRTAEEREHKNLQKTFARMNVSNLIGSWIAWDWSQLEVPNFQEIEGPSWLEALSGSLTAWGVLTHKFSKSCLPELWKKQKMIETIGIPRAPWIDIATGLYWVSVSMGIYDGWLSKLTTGQSSAKYM